MNDITIYLTSSIGAGFVGNKKYPVAFTLGELLSQETGQSEARAFDNYHVRVNRNPTTAADMVLLSGMRVSISPKKVDGGAY